MRERNHSLDVLKIISYFFIILRHVSFQNEFIDPFRSIFNYAPILFCLISGYYAYGNDVEKIKKKFFKFVRMTAFGIAVFLIYNLVVEMKNDSLDLWISEYFNWKTPIYFFVFCTIKWAIVLWYLIAMAETYFVWIFIVKKGYESRAVKLTWPLILLGAVIIVAVETFNLPWSLKVNFAYRTLPWFMLGYLIRTEYADSIMKMKGWKIHAFSLLSIAVCISSIVFKSYVKYGRIAGMMLAPSLFILTIRNQDDLTRKSWKYIGDRTLLFVYIVHVPLIKILESVAAKYAINEGIIYRLLSPIIFVAGSFIVAIVLDGLCKRIIIKCKEVILKRATV